MKRRRITPGVLVAIVALITAACGGTGVDPGSSQAASPDASGSSNEELTAVTFLLDYVIGGEHSPYVLGVEKGFFSDEGLAVDVREGFGSSVTVQLVANSDLVDFGNANAPPVILGVNEGAPIKMVANFTPTNRFQLIWIDGETDPIESIEDLRDKKFGMFQGTSESTIVPLILEKGNLTEDDVEIVQGPPPTSMYTALLQGRIDVLMGIGNEIPDLQVMEPNVEFKSFMLADSGIDSLAHGLITTDDSISSRPEVVAAFVKGAQRSWQYILEDPAHLQEAIDLVVEKYPSVKGSGDSLLAALQSAVEVLRAGAVEGEPLGYTPEEAWLASFDLINISEDTQVTKPPSEFYTNEFLSDSIVMTPELLAGD
ncbi:MAG: NitT/TauT family transport system substrate-binding protein [Chloroflexota bacterium]|nr:NitT/TauT family transport system substrate-binding protein [Chloroflexota bacterium]